MNAVNVADLAAAAGAQGTATNLVMRILIAPVTESRIVVVAERGKVAGDAIVLECDDERAEAIVEIIRKKYKKHELRCYRGKSKTWRRV